MSDTTKPDATSLRAAVDRRRIAEQFIIALLAVRVAEGRGDLLEQEAMRLHREALNAERAEAIAAATDVGLLEQGKPRSRRST